MHYRIDAIDEERGYVSATYWDDATGSRWTVGLRPPLTDDGKLTEAAVLEAVQGYLETNLTEKPRAKPKRGTLAALVGREG